MQGVAVAVPCIFKWKMKCESGTILLQQQFKEICKGDYL